MTDRLTVGPWRHGHGGELHFGRYGSGEIAMMIISPSGQREAVATVALIDHGGPDPRPGVWLKGWGGNDGLPEALVTAGIVTLTGRRHATGFVEAVHADLTPATLRAMESSDG